MKYLCVFDMDGTLLDSHSSIPEKNKEALAELKRRGIGVVLATGRTELMTRKYVQDLDIALPVIANNGSLVVDVMSRKIIYQNTFTLPVLTNLIEYAIANRKDYFIYTIDKVFYSPDSEKIKIMHFYNTMVPLAEQIEIVRLPENSREVLSMLPNSGDHGAFKMLFSYLMREDYEFLGSMADVEAIPSQAEAFDVMPVGSTKGNALEFLVGYLGLDPRNVFAFGDNHNDLTMLDYAAYAVVPYNGVDEAKEIADFVTVSNEDAGVAQGIYEFVIPKIASFSAR